MPSNIIIDCDKTATHKLVGEIGYETINNIIKQFSQSLKPEQKITINLSEVVNAQTVVLSLILEFQRLANANNCSIIFTDIPKNLQGIAKLNGVDEFFHSG